MYIPKPALEDCLTSEISASGGDVMYDYITGSQIRRVHYFGWNTGSYEFEVYQGCTDSTQLFMVGGGGSGGFIPSQSVGSGPPYNLSAPGGMLGAAGGGGAGGVMHINPNKELTGSLALVPGKYPIYIGEGGKGGIISSTSYPYGAYNNGGDTTFKYAFRLANDADIPSGSATSSRYDYDSIYIKAGGGGFGAYGEWFVETVYPKCNSNQVHWEPRMFNASDGGCGGGAGQAFNGSVCSWYGYSGSVEFPFRNQGYHGNGGIPPNLAYGGGGGAGGVTQSSQPAAYWLGGQGVAEDAAGFYTDYSPGGSAQDTSGGNGYQQLKLTLLFDSASQRNFVKGVGGHGAVSNIQFSDYNLPYPPYNQGGWIDDLEYVSGTPGEAIITYALTGSQLTNGKLYYIDGGATGGDFTFLPCGEVRIETLTVPAGKQACICAMDTGLDIYVGGRSGNNGELWWRTVDLPVSSSDQYKFSPEKQMASLPSGSGTVTFTTGSSCNAYVPFEGWEECGPCKQSAPAGIYIGFDISGSSGRTNPLPYYKYPDTEVHYTSSQNYITESRYNNHDSGAYFETRIGAFSNDYDDDVPYENFIPSASFNTNYQDQNVTFTTGSQCFTYYDCDPLTFTPLTASGGTEGTFISGSGIGNEFIYKYHIFEVSGSSNEPFTRSFQDFTITSGYSDDVNMLVIGPGGVGGWATGSGIGNAVWGGGGGAGQVKVEKLDGLCDSYGVIKIAPGFAQPWDYKGTDTVDNWQRFFGQTIVSSSTGVYYTSAGIGGRGSSPGEFAAISDWTERSGSGGGGASVYDPGTYASGGYDTLQTDGGDGWSGSLTQVTGSGGGGGGSAENGYDGVQGTTARGGEGGNGLRLNFDGTLRYYAGGGAGYGPGGPSDGGLGGGGTSGNIWSTGSFYGAGGGAWMGPRQTYTYPWGDTWYGSGRGGDGVVIINYKWKENTSPVDFISYRGLSQYYDMYSKDSYDGTGSLVYSLWNDGTASLGNEGGWKYNTTVLDGSGSLEVVTSSLHPYVTTEVESGSQISVLQTWFSNNVVYDQSSSSYPILSDEQFGTSSFGMYAGDLATYGEAVVIRIGDTEVTTISGSAANYIPRGGFHISQFSYNQNTNELLWYVDGYSGSAVVNEDITIDDINLSFNSSSAVYNPDSNPVYPSASQAVEYEVQMLNASYSNFTFEFVAPQTGELITRTSNDYSNQPRWRFASTTTPVITEGSGSITSGSVVDYYPSASLYYGRTGETLYRRTGGSYVRYVDTFYDVNTCQWTTTDYYANITRNLSRYTAQNSFYTLPSYDTNVTQSFFGYNDCIYRPPVGLGDDSSYNLTAIYTASMTWEEMRHNDDYLYPRY